MFVGLEKQCQYQSSLRMEERNMFFQETTPMLAIVRLSFYYEETSKLTNTLEKFIQSFSSNKKIY